MTALEDRLAYIVRLLLQHRLHFTSERGLGDGVEALLRKGDVPFEREKSVDCDSRPDFVLWGNIGLELKTQGGLSEVTRQMHRYAQIEHLAALVLCTTRMQHTRIASVLAGKPVRVACLTGGLL